MSVPLAYLGIILIWSTTPIAIKWSGDEVGFLFGVSSRMLLGLAVSLLLVALLRKSFPWHKQARHAYVAVGLPLYIAMMSVYWGAQYIPSGLISVIFGLTPLMTGLIAVYWIQEKSFTPFRVLGMLMAMAGLAIIFQNSLVLGPYAHLGILGVLGAVFFHSLGTVWVKKVGNDLPAMVSNTGGLVVACVLYVLTWLLVDGTLPEVIPDHTTFSILYLAIVGSVFGAILFYYALKHVDTGKMAVLTLVTPVTALALGAIFNGEVLDMVTLQGTALVLGGLMAYQWAESVMKWVGKKTVDIKR